MILGNSRSSLSCSVLLCKMGVPETSFRVLGEDSESLSQSSGHSICAPPPQQGHPHSSLWAAYLSYSDPASHTLEPLNLPVWFPRLLEACQAHLVNRGRADTSEKKASGPAHGVPSRVSPNSSAHPVSCNPTRIQGGRLITFTCR